MALWKRSKKEDKPDEERSSSGAGSQATGASSTSAGIVSSVLSAPTDASEQTPFADIVARRFGPGQSQPEPGSRLPPQHATSAADPGGAGGRTADPGTPAHVVARGETSGGQGDAHDPQPNGRDPRDRLRAVEPLFSDQPATPELEVDLMAHIGRETTITGDIVAEEDLEIQGTIEGSVRLANHQVTVGNEGHVKASVDAHTVIVFGKITGDVVASELVEVEKGGIVGGDIKSPRVIMHDGAIVVGGLDMSASLPNPTDDSRSIGQPKAKREAKADAKAESTREAKPEAKPGAGSERPKLEWVDSDDEPESAESRDGAMD